MASASPSEHEIQQRIRLACGRGAVRLWRNNTGALVDQQGRFGLCKGSSDLIDELGQSREPVQITGKRGNAVLLSEDDWRAIQETLHLVSIPGMRESILRG
jgi:hypothetical protein